MEIIAKWCYRRFSTLTQREGGWLEWEELPQLARDGWIEVAKLAIELGDLDGSELAAWNRDEENKGNKSSGKVVEKC